MTNKINNNDLSKRDLAYELMREVRLIAESLDCYITEDDFAILDKIDAAIEQTNSEEEI